MSQVPYQLLELSIISAQDLAPVFKNLRTYALTWIKPDRKLRTRTDQKGRANPTWNDRFVFRVDDAVLNSDASFVIIEIYAVGWLKDSLVGSVSVAVTNLIPPSVRSERRFVALQIRRPSGRPQGILNMGVSLLDNTMRSMPLCTELSGSTVGFSDLWIKEKIATEKEKKQSPETIRLLRSSSDRTDLTSTIQGEGNKKKKKTTGSACNYGNAPTGIGSVMDNGFGSVVTDGGGGSMVNGSVVNSDVGPSASVVMAAVAMGLYPIHHGPSPKPGSSVLEDWTVAESAAEEGLKTRIERWRMDLAQGHDPKYQRLENGKRKQKKHRHQRRRSVNGEEEEDEGKFTCFGNACGCEFTIVCGGGGGGKNKKGGNKKNRRRGYNTSSSKTSDSELCS